MSLDERIDYVPASHQQAAVQKMDQAWGEAVEKGKSAIWDAFGAAHYPFQDPKGAMDAIGDFQTDLAEKAWKEIREAWGVGRTWWNEITNIEHTPCEPTWNVILTLALPAAADALYLFLVPSPEEILENYLQPYPSKTARRGSKDDRPKDRKKSRSGKTRKSWAAIPDVDNWAAAMIPGAHAVKGRKAGAPTRWIFEGIDRLDRVAWWFLVVEATEQFFTSWTSGMREARFCSQQWDILAIGRWSYGPGATFSVVPTNSAWVASVVKNAIVGQTVVTFQTPLGARLFANGSFTYVSAKVFSKVPQNSTLQIRLRVQAHRGSLPTITTYSPWVKVTKTGEIITDVTSPFDNTWQLSIEMQTQGNNSGFEVSATRLDVSVFAKTVT